MFRGLCGRACSAEWRAAEQRVEVPARVLWATRGAMGPQGGVRGVLPAAAAGQPRGRRQTSAGPGALAAQGAPPTLRTPGLGRPQDTQPRQGRVRLGQM